MQPTVKTAGIRDVRFGKDVTVVEPVNLYECAIGDHCFVGPFVEIQSGVVLGAHTRVQSHAFICEGVTIGEHCFISHGVMFVNDLFADGGPAGGDKSKWKETHIGNLVIAVGGRTGRDGLHGATFSSAALDNASMEEDVGAVQIGSPIEEKKATALCPYHH